MSFSEQESSSLPKTSFCDNFIGSDSLVVAELDYSEQVNFAFQQNAIPVIRRLEVRNNSDADWYDVECHLSVSPEWAESVTHRIDLLPAGSSYTFTDLPLPLNLSYLANLSERVRGEIRLRVSHGVADGTEAKTSTVDASADGRQATQENLESIPQAGDGKQPGSVTVLEKSDPVDVYAYDEWTGLKTLPEILAAFVTPNLSVVEQLLSNTTRLLRTRTASSALDGYQAKSKKRVYEILAAIFDSVREQGISYSNPPASFETTGQRIRFGSQIMNARLATCLDLALLFASLIEQAGLNALVLIHKGHAYAGCWLVDENFSDAATDDLQTIRKRKELEELIVFETTLACDGHGAGFADAMDAAEKHLYLDDLFEYAIDIKRSRSSRIRPLPLQRNETGVDVSKAVEQEKAVTLNFASNRRERTFHDEILIEEKPSVPQGRVEHWKQQLLDLTRRNRLLNFRETKQTIPLLCPQPEHIEDQLVEGKSFKILHRTPLMAEEEDPRSMKLLQQGGEANPLFGHLMDELQAKRLRSPLGETELSRRLLELYRKVRLENEESGANTLFLALGFLEWKENREADRSFRAPLLLAPVQLQRKSIQHGFSLQRYDEDTLVNVTLLEMLRRDYNLDVPGLDPLPEDDSGVDVERVFRIFQHAVRDMQGWEVHREVWIGQFSFNKFLLWKDLQDRTDLLSQNAVVDHLINRAGQTFSDGIENLRPEELDTSIDFDELYCPLSSDSSQLAAVIAATRGKNFVLNGPPGTGKSQTITNIIAQCLAEGKRVLFVAEKQAALNVVHHRLSQIGLAPFCLELHSHKSGKSEVLRQFSQAMEYVNRHTGTEWEESANRLQRLRDELNTYVQELHRQYPNHLSAYHCFEWLVCNREAGKSYKDFSLLDIPSPETQSNADLDALVTLCEKMVNRGAERRLPPAAKSGFARIRTTQWSPDKEDAVFAFKQSLAEQLAALLPLWEKVSEATGLDTLPAAEIVLQNAAELAEALRNTATLPPAFVTEGNWPAFSKEATALIACGRIRDAALTALDGFDIEQVRAIDTSALEERWRSLEEKGGALKGFKQWLLLKPVRQARHKGAPKWKGNQAETFFNSTQALKSNQTALDAGAETAKARLGTHWKDGKADWDHIAALLSFGDKLHALIEQLANGSVEQLVKIRSKIGEQISTGAEFLQADGATEKTFHQFSENWQALLKDLLEYKELLQLQEVPEQTPLPDWLPALADALDEHRNRLPAWCLWQKSWQQAEGCGLMPLLKAIDSGSLPLERLPDAFAYAYRNTLLRKLLSLSPVLRDFYGDEQQKRIDTFRKFDKRYTELTGQIVAAKLAARLPKARTQECPRNSELGIIQREIVKKTRHKAVRTLLAETPNVTPCLKPCFLMSPLSVAQYLDPALSDFDLVVFDEASQIPVWDAIGAIARGKQVIVTGDPKQLPPTNFFNRSDSDEPTDESTQHDDLESILDECLGSGLKEHMLRWHYRSRKEGLIAFSNYQYYRNELHTFPAANTESIGVQLVPVANGYYDKGKSRVNKAEAEAIKAEVIRRLNDPQLRRFSIGIVTFSQAQQQLIMDKMEEVRREHPELEKYFNDDAEEPLFIKNLENVQGDERDVILFSICYAPDQNGNLSMNFGPLNREGGERRLNVAITRAKHDVMIFSTLRAEQIDLSRTKAIGSAHLKTYLEYAERGTSAIRGNLEAGAEALLASKLEKDIAAFLSENGYTVHTQVGCSGYRIDIAVVHPDSPDRYAIGIECDGAGYHRSATARDRDQLRQAVLEGLGWKVHRIWATDWWRDYEAASEELLTVVKAAVEASTAEAPPPATPEDNSHETTRHDQPSDKNEDLSADTGAPDDSTPQDNDIHSVHFERIAELPTKPAATHQPEQSETRRRDYPQLRPQALHHTPQEGFYEPRSKAKIRAQIERIIESEGPISKDLLFRRVAHEWGFGRVAARIRGIIEAALPRKPEQLTPDSAPTFWPEKTRASDYSYYRVADSDTRKLEDTPLIEVCNAALDILEKHISFPEENFPQEVVRQFGINRVTQKASDYALQAIAYLIRNKTITCQGGFYAKSDE